MRLIFAVFAVWLAICLVPDGRATSPPEETLYPSHHCEGGSSWYVVATDSDSVTVRCYADADPDQNQDNANDSNGADLELERAWQKWEAAQVNR